MGKRQRTTLEAIDLVSARPAWQAKATCRGLGTALFYGEEEGVRGAKANYVWAICDLCPVKPECLSYALECEKGQGRNDRHGLYAFSTPADRSKMDVGELDSWNGRYCGSVKGWVAHKLWDQEPCALCQERWDDYLQRNALTPIVSFAKRIKRTDEGRAVATH